MCDLGDFPPLQSAAERQLGMSDNSSTSSPYPCRSMVGITRARWRKAEGKAEEIIRCIQPTEESEVKRWAVIEHVQKLIKTKTNCEVFIFGSVPLRTYLPEGDIDLTVFDGPNSDGKLVRDVFSIMQAQVNSEDAKFAIADVRYIDAEIDRKLGKSHLFKKSVILIKAWCYYESHILGAQYGLISTYALETMVLYILHVFQETLCGPLSVLYRFLDYFSKYDWGSHRIDLHVAASETDDDLLLTKEFLRNCVDLFTVRPKGRCCTPDFPTKWLNVVDPLKRNNNLGRSVGLGNLKRICSAFSYGVKKLREILLFPRRVVAEKLVTFFTNTLLFHGRGAGPFPHDFFPIGSDAPRHLDAANRLPNFTRVEEDASLEENIVSNKTLVSRTMREDLKASSSSSASTDCSSVARTASWHAQTRLLDLAGDIDLHLRNLHQAQCRLELESTGSELPIHIRRRAFIHMNSSKPVSRQPASFVPDRRPTSKEDMSKQYGIGTYISETSFRSYRERLAVDKSKALPRDRKNDHEVATSSCTKLPEGGSQKASPWMQALESGGKGQRRSVQEDLPQSPHPYTKLPEGGSQKASPWMQALESGGKGQRRSVQEDLPQSPHPLVRGYFQANNLILQEERRPEGASLAPVPLSEYLPEAWKRLSIDRPQGQGSVRSSTNPVITPKTPERPTTTYQLQDKCDFPPLSG